MDVWLALTFIICAYVRVDRWVVVEVVVIVVVDMVVLMVWLTWGGEVTLDLLRLIGLIG